jgi:hypothetical protein
MSDPLQPDQFNGKLREAWLAAIKQETSKTEVIMETSPTGSPLFPWLKGNVGKWLAGLVGTAAVVLPLIPSHTIFAQILTSFVGLGGAIGIVGPGLRKP